MSVHTQKVAAIIIDGEKWTKILNIDDTLFQCFLNWGKLHFWGNF